MDIFRERQKAQCADGSQRGCRRPYGCRCCRPIANLSAFKVWSRRKARARINDADRRRGGLEAQAS